jgi:hypothetical protein
VHDIPYPPERIKALLYNERKTYLRAMLLGVRVNSKRWLPLRMRVHNARQIVLGKPVGGRCGSRQDNNPESLCIWARIPIRSERSRDQSAVADWPDTENNGPINERQPRHPRRAGKKSFWLFFCLRN